MVFQGWNASTTQDMELEELAMWNDKAVERYNMNNER